MAQEQAPVKEEAPKQEKQTNCIACNKPIKRLRRYYRDGKFYCSKTCFKKMKEKAKAGSKAEA